MDYERAMDTDTWNAVDRYISSQLLPDDPVFDEVLAAADEAGLPPISVSAPQGMLLHVLARCLHAGRVLELGTLAGYSTIWLARALPPGGRVVTLEVDPLHAEVARRNFERAGIAELVDLHVGPALETLPRLADSGEGPFDLVFIDADKPGYPEYLEWALRLSRPGTVIVADNVVRDGTVVDETSDDPTVRAVRRFTEQLGRATGVVATEIQTVGSKGYDGFAIAVVTG